VEKSKVTMTGDKTEMAMELKPESLGKLQLKIVTEQGILTAKFVAESQQVKQILESNMQTLKDSLESQGFNVQGFSVSVRQDSNGDRRNDSRGDNENNARSTGAISRTKVNTGIQRMYGQAAATSMMNSNNPYNLLGSSTVNFTA
jgi:flagellar hook-length control protein FliK